MGRRPPAAAGRLATAPGPTGALVCVLALLSGCAGEVETADGPGGGDPGPGLSGTVSGPLYGGAGDQLAPSVRGNLLAFVDYSGDANGSCRVEADDLDCVGLLRVVELETGQQVAAVPVGAAWPAVGDGIVAWTELPDGAKGEWYGHVRVLALGSGEQRELSTGEMQLDLSGPPAVDGKLVAFLDASWQSPGVHVHDLGSGRSSKVQLRQPNGAAPVALGDGRLAFIDRDPRDWSAQAIVVELASGARTVVEPEPGLSSNELFQPALGEGRVAVKQGQQWACYDATGATCGISVVAQELATGQRFVHRGTGISRFGPLLLAAGSVLWLDGRDGPYSFFGVAFGGTEERRVTPEGTVLPWAAPGSADGGQLVWSDRSGGDFDVFRGELRLR